MHISGRSDHAHRDDAPVGLLVVADAHHVDRAIEAHDSARESQGGVPLAGTGLRGQASDALLTGVVRLRTAVVPTLVRSPRLEEDLSRHLSRALAARVFLGEPTGPAPQEQRYRRCLL